MKTVLDIKNMGGVMKPEKNNVIMYDGKEWYVTTKQDLFKEYNKKIEELEKMIEENKKFKKDVSAQLVEMSEIIKTLLIK